MLPKTNSRKILNIMKVLSDEPVRLSTRLSLNCFGDKSKDLKLHLLSRQRHKINAEEYNQFKIEEFIAQRGCPSKKLKTDFESFLSAVADIVNDSAQQKNATRVMYNIMSKADSKAKGISEAMIYFGFTHCDVIDPFERIWDLASSLKNAKEENTDHSSLRNNIGADISFNIPVIITDDINISEEANTLLFTKDSKTNSWEFNQSNDFKGDIFATAHWLQDLMHSPFCSI